MLFYTFVYYFINYLNYFIDTWYSVFPNKYLHLRIDFLEELSKVLSCLCIVCQMHFHENHKEAPQEAG